MSALPPDPGQASFDRLGTGYRLPPNTHGKASDDLRQELMECPARPYLSADVASWTNTVPPEAGAAIQTTSLPLA